MQLFYCAISSIGILALLMLALLVKNSDLMAASNKRLFSLSLWVVIAVMLAEIATVLCEGAPPRYRAVHILGNVCGFGLSPLVPLLIGCALGGIRKTRLLLFSLPAAVSLLLSVSSAFFPLVFWVDSRNSYERGGAFWVYILACSAALLFLLGQTLSVTRSYQNSSRLLPAALFLFVILGTAVQVVLPWLHLSWLCVAFALMLYYVYCCDLLQQVDGLTGLLNRRTYEYHLRSTDRRDHAAVLVFDIDDFKSVNDRYGHPFGDHCLTAVSACIRKTFFHHGLCFRIGGDEFCVLLQRTDRDAVERLCRRFLRKIEAMRAEDSRLPLVSIGSAFTGDTGASISAAVSAADQDMYRFKRQRKENTVSGASQ